MSENKQNSILQRQIVPWEEKPGPDRSRQVYLKYSVVQMGGEVGRNWEE